MNNVLRFLKDTREYLTPVLTESVFLERGLLTPEEFVKAGDHLVHTCPTWSWASGDPTKVKPYLPVDKQFLVSNGAPCYRRVSHLNSDTIDHNIAGQFVNDSDGDWCAPELLPVNPSDCDDAGKLF